MWLRERLRLFPFCKLASTFGGREKKKKKKKKRDSTELESIFGVRVTICLNAQGVCLPGICVCVSASSMLGERPSLSAS